MREVSCRDSDQLSLGEALGPMRPFDPRIEQRIVLAQKNSNLALELRVSRTTRQYLAHEGHEKPDIQGSALLGKAVEARLRALRSRVRCPIKLQVTRSRCDLLDQPTERREAQLPLRGFDRSTQVTVLRTTLQQGAPQARESLDRPETAAHQCDRRDFLRMPIRQLESDLPAKAMSQKRDRLSIFIHPSDQLILGSSDDLLKCPGLSGHLGLIPPLNRKTLAEPRTLDFSVATRPPVQKKTSLQSACHARTLRRFLAECESSHV